MSAASTSFQLRSVILEITNRCNLRCLHCGSSSGKARADEFSTAELAALIDDLRGLGCEEVTLLGGEVFLREDWEALAGRIRNQGMRLIVVTNGLLVDDTLAKRLARLDPYVVGVSIDGATPESYRRVRGGRGFEASVGALHRLLGAGLPAVNAITTFQRLNLPDFDAFVELFAGTAINWQVQIAGKGGERFRDELFFLPEDFSNFAEKVIEARLRRMDLKLSTMDDFGYYPLLPAPRGLNNWAGCQAGISILAIRSNGDVLPCLSLGDPFVVANVRKETLAEIWASEVHFERFRHKQRYLKGACAVCEARERCRGGCSEIAWSVTGNIFEDPYCLRTMERARLLAAIC